MMIKFVWAAIYIFLFRLMKMKYDSLLLHYFVLLREEFYILKKKIFNFMSSYHPPSAVLYVY